MKPVTISTLLFFCKMFYPVSTLDNGIGNSPLLGWTTGERYPCLTDCINYPDDCISEHLIRTVADMLTLSSFQEAGYQHIIIGDCWMDKMRDERDRLRADRNRFPSGMANLSSYLHGKNLKLGLYMDLGAKTCGGFPGSLNRYDLDAETLASWKVDVVVAGACGLTSYIDINKAYPDFGSQLNRTGVQMTYVCEWPFILNKKGGGQANYTAVAKTCNYFRISDPVKTTELLTQTVQNYNGYWYLYKDVVGPGSYIDLDQLVVGTSSLSHDQEKFQLSFWAIVSSPLLVSCDMTQLNSRSKRLLLNEKVIRINQDSLGFVGRQKLSKELVTIWTKPILPEGSFAVALLNTNIAGLPSQTSFQLSSLDISGSARYNVTEVFSGDYHGVFKPWHYFNCEVEPSGALLFQFIAF
ncbi:hypothetical protein HELRODRAFT_98483 [Helobdella robusta]|uniref:Alpha-galactosidase n=1 Tax=Helobdella robusta TaxID=6412 RepID=T1G9N2_HELRO|nr:hypothetical protein HELRODRAFT_98483 [Helobdella robusta]ESO07803.1 hypothetical protein HELRODRAFT_98483 [Helobdella robusta]